MSRGGCRYPPDAKTRERIQQFIRENHEGMSYGQMAEEISKEIGKEYSPSMICNYANRMGMPRKKRIMPADMPKPKVSKKYIQTLCWWCANAVPGRGCEWADRFEPVPGWDAEPTILNLGSGFGTQGSFLVKSCEKYVEG